MLLSEMLATQSVSVAHVISFIIVQIGSWAGNLMLTHDNNNFPSDVYTIMESVGATVTIGKQTNKQTNKYCIPLVLTSFSYR